MSGSRARVCVLVDRGPHPDNRSLLLRLCLKVNASAVAAKLVIVYSISLVHHEQLKAALPRGKKKPAQVLRRCHDRFHGEQCESESCVVRHPELLVPRAALLRSYEHQLTSALVREALSSVERKQCIRFDFDFRAGRVYARKQEMTSLSPLAPTLPPPAPSLTPCTAPLPKRTSGQPRQGRPRQRLLLRPL